MWLRAATAMLLCGIGLSLIAAGPVFAAATDSDGSQDTDRSRPAIRDPQDSMYADTVFPVVYTIPELYDSLPMIADGAVVNVVGEYIHPDLGILVTSYAEYLNDELMPANSSILLTGLQPIDAYWEGGLMIVSGGITVMDNPNPAYVTDTLLVSLEVTSIEYLKAGWLPSPTPRPDDDGEGGYLPVPVPVDCDSCKFAILVSSMGTNGAHAGREKPTYWENIVNLRRHKIDNEGYCPENIFVHFADGTSDDETQIGSDSVEAATEAALDATHDEIARRIAECKRNGKDSEVQKMFTNHGSNDNGVVLFRAAGDTVRDHRYLSPDELTAMQQKLIDSCCKTLKDEFVTCYGGDMLNGLKDLNNLSKTQIHANSAAPDYAVGWSPRTGGHRYLNKKIDCLSDSSKTYEECVREAEKTYLEYLEGILTNQEARQQYYQDTIGVLEARRDQKWQEYLDGTIDWDTWVAWRNWLDAWINYFQGRLNKTNTYIAKLRRQLEGLNDDGTGQGCPSWVRHTFHHYCEWKEFVAPPGGELRVDFSGWGGCGNVTVWEEFPSGLLFRARQWNWNLPFSNGYLPGYERRVIHVPLEGSGRYWIHNDNEEFTIDVESFSGRPDPDEDFSNGFSSAGFSLGGADGSAGEFGAIVALSHTSVGTNADGFLLSEVPMMIDPYEGVLSYTAQFNIPEANLYWTDMQLQMNVMAVFRSGGLDVTCPGSDNSHYSLWIDTVGEYLVDLGAIVAGDITGNSITFTTSLEGTAFAWDSWGLRTLVLKYEPGYYVCGMYSGGYTGNTNCSEDGKRNLGDITRLIDRVYVTKLELCNEGEGNTDGDEQGKINLGDITKLIDHVYVSKSETAACE
jgi:hypothetical protein